MMTSPDTWIFPRKYSETFHRLFRFLWIINESFVHFWGIFGCPGWSVWLGSCGRTSRVSGSSPHSDTFSINVGGPFLSAPAAFHLGRGATGLQGLDFIIIFSSFSQRQHFLKANVLSAGRNQREESRDNNGPKQSVTYPIILPSPNSFTLLPFPVLQNNFFSSNEFQLFKLIS